MRFFLTKIVENVNPHGINIKSTFNITKRYKFDYILMFSNLPNGYKLWFGKIDKFSQQIHDCRYIDYDKETKKSFVRTSLASYTAMCAHETWYGIKEREYNMLLNVKTANDLIKIVDNIVIEKDLHINLNSIRKGTFQ